MNCQLNRSAWVNICSKIKQSLCRYCVLCHASISDETPVCVDCQALLPWLVRRCHICANPLQTDAICGRCLRQTPVFHRIITPFTYQWPLIHGIQQFKNQGHFVLARWFAEQICACISSDLGVDGILAVPLCRRALRYRGYNQAALLAGAIQRHLGCAMLHDTVVKIRSTSAQKRLTRVQRQRNLRGAFQVCRPVHQYRHLLLVDDVITTGATVNCIIVALLAAGVSRVSVCCIARVREL